MNIPLELDAIVVTVGEEIASIEDEKVLNWNYENEQWIREISEDTFTVMFSATPYRAKKYYRCEHHFAHYMNAEWMFGRKNKGIIIDGCGDYGVHISVFEKNKKVKKYTQADMVSIGDLYYETSADLLGRQKYDDKYANSFADRSGNLMGLISYGHFNETYANHLRQYSFEDFVGEAMNKHKYWSKSDSKEMMLYGFGKSAISDDKKYQTDDSYNYPMSYVWTHENGWPFVQQWHLDWMKTWQTVLSEKLEEFFDEWCKHDDQFVYSGGVAHNVVINEALNKKFPNMKIPPSIGDEGMSLGSMFAYLDFMGIEAPACPTTNWQPEVIPMMNNETVSLVKDFLVANKVVAVCQGESHIGPRALGNRSLIYLPNKRYAAHYFNERNLKSREWWRPYGIIILEEELSSLLHTKTKSPYMLHTARPTPEGESALSGVIHVDNTVRYQTVNDGPYAELLRQLKEIGLPPAIVNTSLNAHGKPMCHTTSDALSFTQQYAPDAVVIGDEVYITNHRGVS
jgi:predicted NodU family carbamoyl transferase